MRAGTLRVIVLYSTVQYIAVQCSIASLLELAKVDLFILKWWSMSLYYVTRYEVVMSLALFHLHVTVPSDLVWLHGLNQCGREGGYSDGDVAARERSRCQLLLHSKSLWNYEWMCLCLYMLNITCTDFHNLDICIDFLIVPLWVRFFIIHVSTADCLTFNFPTVIQSGRTALIHAVEKGNESLVTMLLGYGADTNLPSKNVRHYLFCAYLKVCSL